MTEPSPRPDPQPTPSTLDPLLLCSATELARRIRDHEVSSLAVVDAHIRHIQRVNPVLNAVVVSRFDKARQEARLADRRLDVQDPDLLPPFHGVPCTIKESFALTGMPQTSGLVGRKGLVASRDAPTVARLRAAGAIPLGVTNVSELCMWMESDNRVYGRSNNPYDPSRIVGGSSGGEGCIVGAGGSPFGLGADIGGSIRMPAFFNGVFGHKASAGMVPGTGQFPIATGAALRYLCTGPITRRAEDLYPLLKILAGPDGKDGACEEMTLEDPATVDLAEFTVLNVEDNGGIPVSSDLVEAQQRAAAVLESLGARLVPHHFPGFKDTMMIWSAMMQDAGGPSFAELMGQGTPVNPLTELLRWAVGRSDHTVPAIGLAALEKIGAATPYGMVKRLIQQGLRLREEVYEALGSRGILLFPSHPVPAPKHVAPLFPPFNWAYTAIFNILEMPVTQVPLGLNAAGLPLGVQVVSVPGNDHVTLRAAQELEAHLGGWVPPRLAWARA